MEIQNLKIKRIQKNVVKELYDFYKKYILYASSNVIIAFSNYFQLIYKHNHSNKIEPSIHFKYLAKIMLEMRKDLGLKNKGLGENGEMLMKALIIDYNKQNTG